MSHGDSEDEVIACSGLRFRTEDETFSLECASFSLRQHEIVAVVGLNGSGKTTFLKCLSSSSAVRGEMTCNTMRCMSEPMYVSPIQLASLSGDVTVVDYYSLAYVLHGHKGLPVWRRASRLERVLSILSDYEEQEHFKEIAWKRVSELSSGERQRLLLADLLMTRKTILLLDEPASHFDLAFENRLLGALRQRVTSGGAVVVVSHNVGLLRNHVDRTYVVRSSTGAERVAVVEECPIPDPGQDVLAWLGCRRAG